MSQTYQSTRGRLEAYFDGTANETWRRLMSDAPVSRIRATVRAGRDQMRATLLRHLPQDLQGARVLDAGCGAGQLSVELAARGADVVGADISPKLLEVAARQVPEDLTGRITYRAGDMLDPDLGNFDYVVAMDSLIHYRPDDIAHALGALSARTSASIVFTVAPSNLALQLMHLSGKLFPRSDRSPAIQPITGAALKGAISAQPGLEDWSLVPRDRVGRGFYISQAMELKAA